MDINKLKAEWEPKLQEILPGATLSLGRTHYDNSLSLAVLIPARKGGKYPVQIALGIISSFPGNYEIAVSTHAWVTEDQRGKGLGTFLNKVREAMAKANNYKIMMATVRWDNHAEIKILTKNGWKQTFTFEGPTGEIGVWMKEIE